MNSRGHKKTGVDSYEPGGFGKLWKAWESCGSIITRIGRPVFIGLCCILNIS